MISGLIHSGLVAPYGNISLGLLSLRSCWSVKFVRRLRFDNYFHISMMTSSNGNIFPITGSLPFMRGIHRSPVNSPHKGQWHGALMFTLIWAWINAWVNNREAGDLGRHSCPLWRHRNVPFANATGYVLQSPLVLYRNRYPTNMRQNNMTNNVY